MGNLRRGDNNGYKLRQLSVFAQLVVGSNGPPVQRFDTVSVRARLIKPSGERWPDKADWVVEMDWVRAIDNVCELHDMSHLRL